MVALAAAGEGHEESTLGRRRTRDVCLHFGRVRVPNPMMLAVLYGLMVTDDLVLFDRLGRRRRRGGGGARRLVSHCVVRCGRRVLCKGRRSNRQCRNRCDKKSHDLPPVVWPATAER